MAQKKETIKLNKKHGGKEFSSSFRFIGQVKPVRKKEENGDNWYDVPLYQVTTTQTNKERRVLQFNVETAFKNELKVELAGMVKDNAFAWSRKHNNTVKLDWEDRFDKSKLPDETYHIVSQEWDQTEEISEWLQTGMWVDVRGRYEFDTLQGDNGEFKLVKRTITGVYPLRNGEVEIKGLKENDIFRAYPSELSEHQMGYGKADKDGVVKLKVGWLNPEGGSLYICKVDGEKESKRTEVKYNDSVTETERITVRNNTDIEIILTKSDGKKETVKYANDFNSPDFVEINTYEMQIGIKSTYQDEETQNTKVNAVFLANGKEKSVPKDVELTVYYKAAEEGKVPLATAFGRLNRLDFMKVVGIDHNRAEFAMVAVEDNTDDDNPFADVEEKITEYERASTGTKKGLEILNYVNGSYLKQLLTEEEITEAVQNNTSVNDDPFTISDDDLPF